ncbi:hypothetical protein [Blastococcus sp. TF02A-30]|uniref:AraC-like ligand-binding domain-containing protein n=1 Tax=Blastococcus sp. TF02A-30 TaxID=2250580 RepID=UPI000DEB959D|nr:hypothetical protein [Blastococcus sp. TF02A-30]RBY89633.1 hypothetical protein DQ241_09390 [Blastococcus sp. TF02A-30]
MPRAETVQRLEVVTRDVLRAHESIRDTFAGHRLHIRGSQENFRYRQSTATAGELAVDSLHHSMGVREDVDPVQGIWVGLVTGGQFGLTRAGEEVRGRPGDVVLFPQGVPFTCEWQLMSLQVVRLPAPRARPAGSRGDGDRPGRLPPVRHVPDLRGSRPPLGAHHRLPALAVRRR